MIQANELRLGNWVNHVNNNGSFNLQVNEITDKFINVKYNNGVWGIAYDAISPIPLTPEILEKAGFVYEVRKLSNRYVLNKEKANGKIESYIQIAFYDNDILYVHITGIFGTRIPKSKSLHQLQNLYFALTGNELNITL